MQINKEYLEHKVFEQIKEYSEFYNSLGLFTCGWITQGAKSWLNLDTYVFSSIKGTIDSIGIILSKGHVNDSYALLRKYYDSTIINVYTNLFLSDNFSVESFIVQKIENWRNGTDKLPEFRVMSQYIRNSKHLEQITELLYQNDTFKKIRERCNDHTHYNYYHNMVLNDNQVFLFDKRIKALDNFSLDLENIFIQHFSLLFSINEHYMMATDYTDSLEVGMKPEEGSQYWVAPYIQKRFDNPVKKRRPDIATAIKNKVAMELE